MPISALQHYVYCPRQCALIHLDRIFRDNVYTHRGHREHRKVHEPSSEATSDVHTERSLPLSAPNLGVHGVADVVEFHQDGRIVPVEHKVGRRAQREADDIQVAAQAMALEEMFDTAVPRACVFHQASRRRRDVHIDRPIRDRVHTVVLQVRHLISDRELPEAVNDSRCPRCSLIDVCLPGIVAPERRRTPHDPTFDPAWN